MSANPQSDAKTGQHALAGLPHWVVTRPLWLLLGIAVAFPLLMVWMVNLPRAGQRFDFLGYPVAIAAELAYLSIISLSAGIECTKLAANIRDDEFSWFKFCGWYIIGYFVYLCSSVMTTWSVARLTPILVLNGIFSIIGFMTLIGAIKAVFTYPIMMANVLERWQQNEGGPKSRFMSPFSPISLPTLLLRMPQYYAHEAARQAKQKQQA